MVPNALEPGHVLGERFAIVGLLGSGGTASVYLVVDQHAGQQVALKVVHPHLASDPSIRRRIRQEIAAASLLACPTVLVPDELHELDGFLCLTLPYHTGQTLSEYVAATGALPAEQVRALGIRVATALQEAHRKGLLHRDVTANNVMVDNGKGALLMDFGLARAESSTTRSTGMLGTTGYAAPEVYAGERADPRTDLYGLGCVLYLATTGHLPFDSDNAMGALQLQLAEGHPPVRTLRPDCPEDLAITIESLLRREREARPASAGEVVTALTARSAEAPTLPEGTRFAHLEPGEYRVLVSEREGDRSRRKVLRVEEGKARKTLETEVTKRAQQLWTGVLAYMGVHEPEADTPEQLLLRAVTDEADVPAGSLRNPPAVLQKQFMLVENVSYQAAYRITADARSAGFSAQVDKKQLATGWRVSVVLLLAVLTVALPTLLLLPILGIVVLLTGVPAALVPVLFTWVLQNHRDQLPVAYNAVLDPWLSSPVSGRYPLIEAETAPTRTVAPPVVRGTTLLERATGGLDALEHTAESLDLNTILRADLRDTTRDLRERANELWDVLERLEKELAEPVEDASWVEPRLARLRTKKRAGEPIDEAEILRLQGMLRAHEGTVALQGRLESQVTAATAGLLEIAATATAVRRQLLAEPESAATGGDALAKLKREAEAAAAARRELARQAIAR